jgi:hypothetical protein
MVNVRPTVTAYPCQTARRTSYDPADPMGKMFFNILATFGRAAGGPPWC